MDPPETGAASNGKRLPAMNALAAESGAKPDLRGRRGGGAVSMISTGTVRIHPKHPYHTCRPLYWWLLNSQRWTPPRPINVYIIEHAQRLILFDTGQDQASITGSSYVSGGLTGPMYHHGKSLPCSTSSRA